jgi:translation initiation factor IF-3
VRVVGSNGEMIGVLPTREAIQMAYDAGLDLVEIAAAADPPVCKILDLGKYKYEIQKKKNEARKKQKVIEVKEIKMRPSIDEHDYQVKMRQAAGFLKKKDRVKVELFFRGRQIEHLDLGRKILDRFIIDTQADGQVEKEPQLEGKIMSFVLAPKKI